MTAKLRAVIFDLGGVVLDSPLHVIADYERATGIPAGFINRHVTASAPDGAWHRLERGELVMGEAFFAAFDRELEDAGQPIESRDLMAQIGERSQPRPQMLAALASLRGAGYKLAALTNNWNRVPKAPADSDSYKSERLRVLFDQFVESSVVGLRKPDPEIYRLTCRLLAIEPREAAFLDDIGSNLKAARALGMTTIKVDDPVQALAELGEILGLDLGPVSE